MSQQSLGEYDSTEPLKATELIPVHSPIGGEILGFVADSNRDGGVCICREYRHPRPNGEHHFYRKLGGYTMNVCDIEALRDADVDFIVFQEVDNDRCIEFHISQYINGKDGGVVNGRQKLGQPVTEAKHIWKKEDVVIEPAISREGSW